MTSRELPARIRRICGAYVVNAAADEVVEFMRRYISWHHCIVANVLGGQMHIPIIVYGAQSRSKIMNVTHIP